MCLLVSVQWAHICRGESLPPLPSPTPMCLYKLDQVSIIQLLFLLSLLNHYVLVSQITGAIKHLSLVIFSASMCTTLLFKQKI